MAVQKTPQDHANIIAEQVQTKGYCVFFSELLQEQVAFARDSRYRKHVPQGIPVYLSEDLKQLFGKGKAKLSTANLRLVHEAVKAGGVVTSYQRTML